MTESQEINRQYFENRLFGYIDPVPYPPGSYADECLNLSMKMYESRMFTPDEIVLLFKPVLKRMNQHTEDFLFGEQ